MPHPVPKLYIMTHSEVSSSEISSRSSSPESRSRSRGSLFSLSRTQHETLVSKSSVLNLLQPVPSNDFSLVGQVEDLKSKVSGSYRSMDISSAEEDLRYQILEFQTSLNQLKGLHSECTRMLSLFVGESERSASAVNKKITLLREQMSGFAILDSLEDRIEKVQTIIDSRTKKLSKINEWVKQQEDIFVIKRQRFQKISKIALIGFTIGICILILVYLFIKS